jgi:hypothetical protein
VQVRGNLITLDRSFITRLAKHPSLEASDQNIWELTYFVHVGDGEAMKVAIDLIARDYPEGASVDDDHRTREMARALSLHEEIFWNLLITAPIAVRKKVIHFYDVNPVDYVGHDYDEEKARMLKAN